MRPKHLAPRHIIAGCPKLCLCSPLPQLFISNVRKGLAMLPRAKPYRPETEHKFLCHLQQRHASTNLYPTRPAFGMLRGRRRPLPVVWLPPIQFGLGWKCGQIARSKQRHETLPYNIEQHSERYECGHLMARNIHTQILCDDASDEGK